MENQQLAIFKIDKLSSKSLDDTLLFCGYANNKDEIMNYFNQVQKEIDVSMNTELEGEYIVLPALHFKLSRTIQKSQNQNTNEYRNQKGHRETFKGSQKV
tara:strand:+ start:1078 stop:1377 length:300 start_codon:yes stop_codon:yes gene_type:complete